MNKKQKKIQLTLVSIGLLLILLTYFYYPSTQKPKFSENKSLERKLKKDKDAGDQDTYFENIEYAGIYDLDKAFTVRSEKARMFNNNPDIVHMTNMHVILYLNDGRIVNIISDKGRYNKATYDCFFENSVQATDGETQIFAENLDLLATKNTVEIYNKVSINYPTGSVRADKIDYDFETKYFKVSMFDDEIIKMKVVK